MSDPSIDLALDSPVTECGDVVSGEVSWDAGSGVLRGVEVSLSFATDGSAAPRDTGGPEPVQVERTNAGVGRFDIQVPDRGPITFEGRTMAVAWTVEARLDVPSAPDTRVSTPVTVLPRGGLALWARQRAAPPVSPTSEPGQQG